MIRECMYKKLPYIYIYIYIYWLIDKWKDVYGNIPLKGKYV